MTLEEFRGPSPLRRREALLVRRNAQFLKHLQSAQAALSRGARDEALQAAEQAGLLEPEDARVIAILEEAQGSPDADPSTVMWTRDKPRPKPRGEFVGPASWSVATPVVGTRRRATRGASAVISVAVHGLAAAVTLVALIRVVPAVDVTPLMTLGIPSALIGNLVSPDAPQEPDPGQEETDVREPTAVIATTPLADLRLLPLVAPTRSRRPAPTGWVRGIRTTARLEVSGGSGSPTGNMLPEAGPWQQGQVDRAPRLLRVVPPLYPRAAFDQGLEGVMAVILQVVLNRDGVVERTSIVQGVPLLNQAAQAAVEQWVYSPAYRNGYRIPVIFTVSITFDFR